MFCNKAIKYVGVSYLVVLAACFSKATDIPLPFYPALSGTMRETGRGSSQMNYSNDFALPKKFWLFQVKGLVHFYLISRNLQWHYSLLKDARHKILYQLVKRFQETASRSCHSSKRNYANLRQTLQVAIAFGFRPQDSSRMTEWL
ncbi:hypothetical protein [Pontibacter qinzhouensis]|uniref:hypothetical protein n=1 Tax=Pontibacter qinzhouensis TaxID=2603253 RepID=UPI00164FB7E6|nr:hypothetical protein [Pontibacter qinzhouensis]